MADMFIKKAEYVASYTSIKDCPQSQLPEFAFIGRSNVGKSSLINMLTNHKKLAHTSQTPGKTQLINYFNIDDNWHLVDLPGYGYAKISKKQRAKWKKMIYEYLQHRMNMICAMVLIDVRVDPQAIDIEFINWLGEHHVPFVIVFTKADKQNEEANEAQMYKFREALLEYWNALPQQFITSSENGRGREEVLQFIQKTANDYYEQL